MEILHKLPNELIAHVQIFVGYPYEVKFEKWNDVTKEWLNISQKGLFKESPKKHNKRNDWACGYIGDWYGWRNIPWDYEEIMHYTLYEDSFYGNRTISNFEKYSTPCKFYKKYISGVKREEKTYNIKDQLMRHKRYNQNGKRHGKQLSRERIDDKWNCVTYSNGLLHGEYKDWGTARLKNKHYAYGYYLYKHCYYNEGKYHGEYKEWDVEKGEIHLVKHCFYQNGKYHGEYKQYKNGTLIKHCYYHNGKLNGECKRYNKKQQQFVTTFYKKGKKIN